MPRPDDEPPVAPALTLSQWERGTCDLGDALGEHGITWMPGEGQRSGYVQAWVQSERTGLPLGAIVDTPDGLRALAAAANAALPEGHPGKITQADVEACRSGRIACAGEEKAAQQDGRTEDAAVWREAACTLDTLMDKLAALLPPEPHDGR